MLMTTDKDPAFKVGPLSVVQFPHDGYGELVSQSLKLSVGAVATPPAVRANGIDATGFGAHSGNEVSVSVASPATAPMGELLLAIVYPEPVLLAVPTTGLLAGTPS